MAAVVDELMHVLKGYRLTAAERGGVYDAIHVPNKKQEHGRPPPNQGSHLPIWPCPSIPIISPLNLIVSLINRELIGAD